MDNKVEEGDFKMQFLVSENQGTAFLKFELSFSRLCPEKLLFGNLFIGLTKI
jgi:hypothetical protein